MQPQSVYQRIFLYEFITGGGLLADGSDQPFPASLLAEGSAMLTALASDFTALPDVEVSILRDHRLADSATPDSRVSVVADAEQEQAAFAQHAADSDWTVVIAPEFDGHLIARCWFVEKLFGRLLGPCSDLVQLAGDKHATVEHLRAAGVAVPMGRKLAAGHPWPDDLTWPAIVKPCDGAGSQGVRLWHAAPPIAERHVNGVAQRYEKFVPGQSASVAFLCGPNGHIALPPCRQRLSDDGTFAYQGGSLPLPEPLAERATRLAQAAIDTLPSPLGYLGVDLVLGDDPTGREDVVIEINPRLTTSYVGLRAACRDNLAAAMLAVAAGECPALSFDPAPLQFDASGFISY